MLTPRLTNCEDCDDILSLIGEIDCRVATLADSMYNNVTLMLNYPINTSSLFALLNYKRILQCRYVNPNYACDYSLYDIASRVKVLKYKK